MNNRKTLIFVTLVVILAIIGGVAYYIINNQNVAPIVDPKNNFPVGRPTNDFATSSDINIDNGQGTGNSTVDDYYNNLKVASLRQISKDPIAGATAFSLNGQSYARFTDKATGHTYETDLQEISLNRLTNTTIPKIYEAIWSAKGNGVGLRYLNENEAIQTYWAKVGKTSTSTGPDLTGTFLPSNITQFAINPTSDKIFYLLNKTEGSSGFLADINLTKRAGVFDSSASEWLITWPKDDTIIFTTKPSSQALGYVYSFNTKTNAFSKLFGSINGLTTLYNSDADKVLYSESIDQSLTLHAFDSKNKTVTDLSLKTLPEKCVWSIKNKVTAYCAVPQNLPQAEYPDAWYQGTVSFKDQIWQINTATGDTKLISTLISISGDADAINLALDPTESYLLFTNKTNFHLWSLTLN